MKNALYALAGVVAVAATAGIVWLVVRNPPGASPNVMAAGSPPPAPAGPPRQAQFSADVANFSRAAVDVTMLGRQIFGAISSNSDDGDVSGDVDDSEILTP